MVCSIRRRRVGGRKGEMNDKLSWEWINEGYMKRAKVFGGWLVQSYEDVVHEREQGLIPGWDFRIALTFVPDEHHEWEI